MWLQTFDTRKRRMGNNSVKKNVCIWCTHINIHKHFNAVLLAFSHWQLCANIRRRWMVLREWAKEVNEQHCIDGSKWEDGSLYDDVVLQSLALCYSQSKQNKRIALLASATNWLGLWLGKLASKLWRLARCLYCLFVV